MRKYSRVLFFIFSFVLLGFTAFQSYAESIEGNWKIKTEYTVILIKECEKQSWCADIVGFFGPVNSDMNDEEVAKLCDARILEGLEKKDKKYQNGTFFSSVSIPFGWDIKDPESEANHARYKNAIMIRDHILEEDLGRMEELMVDKYQSK